MRYEFILPLFKSRRYGFTLHVVPKGTYYYHPNATHHLTVRLPFFKRRTFIGVIDCG